MLAIVALLFMADLSLRLEPHFHCAVSHSYHWPAGFLAPAAVTVSLIRTDLHHITSDLNEACWEMRKSDNSPTQSRGKGSTVELWLSDVFTFLHQTKRCTVDLIGRKQWRDFMVHCKTYYRFLPASNSFCHHFSCKKGSFKAKQSQVWKLGKTES